MNDLVDSSNIDDTLWNSKILRIDANTDAANDTDTGVYLMYSIKTIKTRSFILNFCWNHITSFETSFIKIYTFHLYYTSS